MDAQRFDYLINGYFDGTLSPADRDELDALVISDSRARDAYWQFAVAHAELRVWAERQAAQITITAANKRVSAQESAARPRFPRTKTWGLMALAGSLLVGGLSAGIYFRNAASHPAFPIPAITEENQPLAQPAAPSQPAAQTPPGNFPVAQLSRVVGVRWSGEAIQPGQRLAAGQSLTLDAGVLELTFDLGARVVVQAPALVKVESATSLRLEKGKLSAQITDVRARGFRVNTPRESIIDQGTEFGVEVTPQRSSRVHVFKGAVDIASSDSREAAEARRLLENSGARMEEGSRDLILLQDTGESFIRRVEDASHDGHVVAYWRFEDRPVGAILPDTSRNVHQVCASVDSSYNGNDLYTYIPESRPTFSDRVPAAAVPQTGCFNRSCLDTYSVPSYRGYGRDVYTHSEFSHAAPIDIQKITPREWTIEASVWPHGVKGEGFPQTFVGRDATYATLMLEGPPRLALQINAQQRFAIRFADVRGRFHEAVAEKVPVKLEHWYHVAAASDGRWLRLYIDCLDGRGYQLCVSAALPNDDRTALGKGDDTAEWTVGRGHVGKMPGKWFRGLIDEVRISDVARQPGEFLFAPQNIQTTRTTKNTKTQAEK